MVCTNSLVILRSSVGQLDRARSSILLLDIFRSGGRRFESRAFFVLLQSLEHVKLTKSSGKFVFFLFAKNHF
jgi:hypothetical protein